METQTVLFDQVVERGCGMDVHRDSVVATISGVGIRSETKTFTTYTNDLLKMKEWLQENNVTHIAMESTGIYWRPVFNIIDDDFEILLVNARHIKNVPGQKTDKKDSKWITKLLLSGLLKGSFIPPRDIRELRDLFRYRRKLTQQASAERNRFEKVLQDANFKLSSVITDVFGKSGSKIIDAILQDEKDVDVLVQLCHARIKSKGENLREALVGNLTDHHKFMIRAIRNSIASIDKLIADIDQQIEKQTANYSVELELLQTIPGINKLSSVAILAEMGPDMSKFPNEHHLASWAGICPGNNESAGKKMSGRITGGNRYLKPILVECAWSASKVKASFFRRKYESLIVRRGKKRALVSIGHKILVAAYFILRDLQPFKDLGYDYLDSRKKDKQIQSYIEKLKNLGVEISV